MKCTPTSIEVGSTQGLWMHFDGTHRIAETHSTKLPPSCSLRVLQSVCFKLLASYIISAAAFLQQVKACKHKEGIDRKFVTTTGLPTNVSR